MFSYIFPRKRGHVSPWRCLISQKFRKTDCFVAAASPANSASEEDCLGWQKKGIRSPAYLATLRNYCRGKRMRKATRAKTFAPPPGKKAWVCLGPINYVRRTPRERPTKAPGLPARLQDLEAIHYCPGLTSLIPMTKPCYTEISFSSTNSYTLGITVLLLRAQSKYLQEKCLWGNSHRPLCNSCADYRCECVSLAHQMPLYAWLQKQGNLKNSPFLIFSPWWSQQFLGAWMEPFIKFWNSGSMNFLWFINGCWENSTDNNVCIFVFTYLLPSCDNNLRPLSNPNWAICALFWYELTSPMLDKHCFENQNSSSDLLGKIYFIVNVLHGFCVSFCHKKKRLNRERKKKPDKNGLSVQLAIDFPTGLYFRHLCNWMQSMNPGHWYFSYPHSMAAYRMAHGTLIAHLLLDFLHGYISLRKGKM